MAEEKKLDAAASAESQKPTYEELKYYCNQLLMQRDKVAERLNQVTDVLNKLPWLFEVLKAEKHFNSDFVTYCAKEIQFILTPPNEEVEKETKKEVPEKK